MTERTSPGSSQLDSRQETWPGISRSNKCRLRYCARIAPSGPIKRLVLKHFVASGERSQKLPATSVIDSRRARSHRAWLVGPGMALGRRHHRGRAPQAGKHFGQGDELRAGRHGLLDQGTRSGQILRRLFARRHLHGRCMKSGKHRPISLARGDKNIQIRRMYRRQISS